MPPKTAVVIATFGLNGPRKAAAEIAIEHLRDQRHSFAIFWLDLVLPGYRPLEFVKGDPFQYIPIKGTQQNLYLFQKECLYNYAVRRIATDYDHYLFLDCDLYSEDPYWFQKYSDLLASVRLPLAQGFYSCLDTELNGTHSQSLISYYVDQRTSDLDVNPGLTIGLTKESFNLVGGFPNRTFEGSDDLVFMLGQLEHPSLEPFAEVYRSISQYLTTTEKVLTPCYLDVAIRHVYHGSKSSRKYGERNKLLSETCPSVSRINPDTLLREWSTPTIPPEGMVMKELMFDQTGMDPYERYDFWKAKLSQQHSPELLRQP